MPAPGFPGVLSQLARLQQQFSGQIAALEEGIRQQRQALAGARDQLPELRSVCETHARWKAVMDRLSGAAAEERAPGLSNPPDTDIV